MVQFSVLEQAYPVHQANRVTPEIMYNICMSLAACIMHEPLAAPARCSWNLAGTHRLFQPMTAVTAAVPLVQNFILCRQCPVDSLSLLWGGATWTLRNTSWSRARGVTRGPWSGDCHPGAEDIQLGS